MARITRPMIPRRGPLWRKKMPQSAGDRVSAFKAEISMATEIVTANWRNSWPDTPGMKAIGTNTDSKTSEMATIGAVISLIAFFVASRGVRSGSSSMTRSTFSTTTIASSTTMPMASTQRQQRHRIRRIADHQEDGEGADQADRDGDRGNDGGAQRAEEQEHDEDDEDEGLDEGLDHLGDRVVHEGRRVVDDRRLQTFGKRAARLSIVRLTAAAVATRVGAGREIDAERDGRLAGQRTLGVHVLGAEFDARHILDPEQRARRDWRAARCCRTPRAC